MLKNTVRTGPKQGTKSIPLIVRARKLRIAGLAETNRLKAEAALTVVSL